jgi:hypothetical protein
MSGTNVDGEDMYPLRKTLQMVMGVTAQVTLRDWMESSTFFVKIRPQFEISDN